MAIGEQLGAAYISIGVDLTQMEADLNAARTKANAFGKDVADAYTAGNTQAKSGITYLDRYIKMIGLGADEIQLLKAELRGVDSKTIDVARQRMEQLRAAAKALNDEQQKGANRAAFLKSLQDQATAVGKTKSELLELKAAEMGVSAQAAPFIAKLREQESAMLGLAKATDKYGLSEKQRIAAMRQVPAQVTDIFVSLAGGQNPMMVMIQQGGQLKDVFGGIVPAARALGSSLLGMVNIYTVAAAGVAALGFAWLQAEKNARAFQTSIALTNDYLGISSSEMADIAMRMTDTSTSFGAASEALNKVAASGRFTAGELRLVSDAAIDMERLTGQSIDTTIGEFEKLKRDPVNAILELNSKYHFLTESTYDQIVALQKQGDELGAAGVAMSAYAGHVSGALKQVESNLTAVERWWRNVKSAALEAWNAMGAALRGMDRDQKIRQLQGEEMQLEIGAGSNSMWSKFENWYLNDTGKGKKLARIRSELAPLLAEQRAEEERALRTNADQLQVAFEADARQYETSAERRSQARAAVAKRANDAIKAVARAEGEGSREYVRRVAEIRASEAAQLKGIEDKYKDPKGRKPSGSGARAARALERADARADLQAFRDDLLREQALIQNQTKVLQAQFQARRVSADDYYTQSRTLMERDSAAQVKALEGQIAALRARSVAGKDSIDNQRQLHQLEAQLAKVRADGATALEVLKIQEEEAAKARANAINQYRESIEQATRAMRDQAALQTNSLYLSAREAERQGKLAQIYAWQREELKKLNDEYERSNKTKDDQNKLNEGTRDVERAARERERVVNGSYDSMSKAQGDWVAGMRRGMQDWVDQNSNYNEQMAAMTGRTMDRMTDALVEFAMTGKMQWKELLAAILKEIVAFLIKKAVVSFAQMFLGAMGGGAGGGGVAMNYTGGGATYAAKGAVFPSAPGLGAYSGQIVSQPTPFYFAKGAALGVMGEAGSEAVMPLKRTSSGELGVLATSSGGVTIYQTFTFHSDGTSTEKTTGGNEAQALKAVGAQMQQVAKTTVIGMMRPGGELYKAGVRAG